MSTPDSTVKTDTTVATTTKRPIAFGNTGVQLNSLEDAFRFATAVSLSGWAPKGMEKAESVLVAIQFGLEIGLSPMAALQNTAVINGRPGIYGDAALALVRSSSLCTHFSEAETNNETEVIFRELQFALVDGDKVAAKDLSKKLAVAQASHKTEAEDFGASCATLRSDGSLEFGRFTVADAKKAGLWGKSGPWSQYPKRMLKFRARGFLLRDVYGDVLKGLRTVEELRDTPAEPVNVTPPSQRLGALLSQTPAGNSTGPGTDVTAGGPIAEAAAPETDSPVEVVKEAA